jgi:transketolase C-terminal domain/subunit
MKLNRIFPVEEACFDIAKGYSRVIFAEEGIKRGGLGEYFASQLLQRGFQGDYIIRAIDGFLPPCSLEEGFGMTGLDADSLYKLVKPE